MAAARSIWTWCPAILPTSTPSCFNKAAVFSIVETWLKKTRPWKFLTRLSCFKIRAFIFSGTSIQPCWTWPRVLSSARTSTTCGCTSNQASKSSSARSLVAEKKLNCTSARSWSSIWRVPSRFSPVRSSSASSMTKLWISLTFKRRSLINVKTRPGVPTTISGFFFKRSIWRWTLAPPVIEVTRSPIKAAHSRKTSVVWMASSCDGDSTNNWVPSPGVIFSINGKANARVFPEPVGDSPSTDSPFRRGSATFCWIKVGSANPFSLKCFLNKSFINV